MSSSEKSEGTLSQQFRKVMTQSALSFSAQDHQGLISYIFFSHDHAVAANGEIFNHPGTRSTAPSTFRLAVLQNP